MVRMSVSSTRLLDSVFARVIAICCSRSAWKLYT
jgi:hypothetical protein